MPSNLSIKDWKSHTRQAYTATKLVAELAIEKTYQFTNYFETVAFVNAVAFIAHRQDHHPVMTLTYNRCMVRFNTHDVAGISATDFECAAQVDALIA
jgi:4a-hydroxytetrahydrobiopterin dehydratase